METKDKCETFIRHSFLIVIFNPMCTCNVWAPSNLCYCLTSLVALEGRGKTKHHAMMDEEIQIRLGT
ncbi:hypothetical protein ACA910_011593 [Epithemia clementina (nom. ined.)]